MPRPSEGPELFEIGPEPPVVPLTLADKLEAATRRYCADMKVSWTQYPRCADFLVAEYPELFAAAQPEMMHGDFVRHDGTDIWPAQPSGERVMGEW